MGKTQRGRGRGKGRGGRAGQPGGRGTAATSAASNDGQQPAAGQQQVPSGEALRMTLQAKPDILSSLKESGEFGRLEHLYGYLCHRFLWFLNTPLLRVG